MSKSRIERFKPVEARDLLLASGILRLICTHPAGICPPRSDAKLKHERVTAATVRSCAMVEETEAGELVERFPLSKFEVRFRRYPEAVPFAITSILTDDGLEYRTATIGGYRPVETRPVLNPAQAEIVSDLLLQSTLLGLEETEGQLL